MINGRTYRLVVISIPALIRASGSTSRKARAPSPRQDGDRDPKGARVAQSLAGRADRSPKRTNVKDDAQKYRIT